MSVKRGQELELRIEDIAFGGKGLCRVDGLAVFVDQAVTGDLVRARVFKKKKKFAEARVTALLEPSPMRVDAPCPYSGYCGGCKWQFLDYTQQLHYKTRHVGESLAHIGGVGVQGDEASCLNSDSDEKTVVHPALASPARFGYRNKMEFSCSDRRWLLPQELGDESIERGFALGLHVPGTFHKVLDIEACLLQPDLGNRILGGVREFIRQSKLPVYGLRSQEGFWRFLMLRHSAAFDRWMVNIVTAADQPGEVQALAQRLTAEFPQVVSVVNNVTGRKASVAVGEFEKHLAGERFIRDRIGEYEFEISAASFFQTNTLGAELLYETVARYARLQGGETVLDLYCGTGTIAIYLSRMVQSVVGLELVPAAVADARRNCRRNGIDNCRFIGGDIKDELAAVAGNVDVMVIDPPRVGMHKSVVKQIKEKGPTRIVYVSCNPATLARDAGMLAERYRVAEVQPVDMFPHTFHIEAVARLERRD